MLLYVEFSVLIVGFYLMIRDYVVDIWFQVSAPIFLILFLNLFSLIAIRMSQSGTGSGNKASGIIFLAGVVIVILGTSVMFLYWFADKFSVIIHSLIRGIKGVGVFLFQLFNQLMVFLVSLLPGEPQQQSVGGSGTIQTSVQMEQMEADYSVLIYAILLVGAIIGVVLLWKIWTANKNKRIQIDQMSSIPDDVVQKRNSLGIREKLRRFYQKVRFFYLSIRYRNTICGLYYTMIRYGTKKGIKKEESCTPREYLYQLMESNENKSFYEPLADQLDAFFFGSDPIAVSKEEISQYKKLFESIKK